VGRLRTVARAAGIGDIAIQGRSVRFGPVQLRESQQLRLKRLYPGTIVKEALGTILVPQPTTARVGGKPLRDQAVVQWASDLIRAVLQDDIGAAAVAASSAAASG
jgi:transcription-repair coupling factor (superfamily II helicase)